MIQKEDPESNTQLDDFEPHRIHIGWVLFAEYGDFNGHFIFLTIPLRPLATPACPPGPSHSDGNDVIRAGPPREDNP